MEIVKDVNVYDKITKGEHICKGNKLYTREDMKKMLKESGLSLDEINTIYNLNAKEASRETQSRICRSFLDFLPDESEVSQEDMALYEIICLQVRDSYRLKVLFWIQCIALIVLAVVFCTTDPQLMRWTLLISVAGVMTYVVASLWADIRQDAWAEVAQKELDAFEDACSEKLNIAIENRQKMAISACNTFHMYECMEDALLAKMLLDLDETSKACSALPASPALADVTLISHPDIDDDLK